MGFRTILLEKNLDEVIDQRLKEKLRDILLSSARFL